jgi:hypothetical protein
MPLLPVDLDEVLRKNPHLRADVAELERLLGEFKRAGVSVPRPTYRLDPVVGAPTQVGQQKVHLLNQSSHLGE